MSEERRLVTILFADVRGSTAAAEAMDPEDLRVLLSRYYAIAREVVVEYGGTLEKFIGDAVMAVFGLPVAHGDDAGRALGAALDLRDRVRSDPRLGDRLPIGIGIASGEVVARRDAGQNEDFLITGDAVNTAARLQQAAEPWLIVVAERTGQAASGFQIERMAGIEAKGKTVPIAAGLLRRRTGAMPTRLPLIGRAGDLAQLELAARRVVDGRRPFLISIVAPAGTGKTRLLEALLDRMPELAPGVQVATAQCLPYGQRLTYWPLRAMLGQLVGVDPDGPPAETRAATSEWLRDRGLDDVASVVTALMATIGVSEDEAIDRATLVAAWRTTLAAAAAEGPVTAVLEDLHWSSDSLLDLLESIAQPQADLPILVVALTRPELLERRPGWGRLGRNTLSLTLDPLSDAEIADLVHHLGEGMTPDVVEAVVERAEGNPFYAGELVRALLDRVGPDLAPERVRDALRRLPDTIQATVLARLDLLSATERRLLQVGSVFGRSFSVAGVTAIEPGLGPDSEGAVERLLEGDMVRRSGPREIAFRHILIRDVAYGMLPRAERAQLHASAGRWLAARAADQVEAYAELIAVHAREAATLATALDVPEALALRTEAVGRLEAAADVALAAGANLEAMRHLRAAFEFATPDRHLDLYERMGATSVHGDTNIDALMRARELARAQGVPAARELRILSGILTYHTRWQGSVAGRPSEAELEALFEEGRGLLPAVADGRTRADFRAAEAFLPFWVSASGRASTDAELEAATASATEALEVGTRLGDLSLQSAALDGLGGLAQTRGDYATVAALARRRLDLGEGLPLAERIDAACMVLWADCVLGELADANRVAEHAARPIQPGQATNWVCHLLAWTSLAAELAGEWDRVVAAANRAYGLWVELGRVPAAYAMRGFLAALEVARARRDDAATTRWRETLEEIAAAFRDSQPRVALQAAMLRDDPTAARRALAGYDLTGVRIDLAERVLAYLCDRGLPPDGDLIGRLEASVPADARLMQAQLHRARGLAGHDATELRLALDLLSGAGARPGVGRLQIELGRQSGDAVLLEAGMEVLRELGDVAQADRFAASIPRPKAEPRARVNQST
jgi:class 3 adenylate cyclase